MRTVLALMLIEQLTFPITIIQLFYNDNIHNKQLCLLSTYYVALCQLFNMGYFPYSLWQPREVATMTSPS